jgi:hypothetical protein
VFPFALLFPVYQVRPPRRGLSDWCSRSPFGLDLVDILYIVHNNDYLEVMNPCGREDGSILTSELIWLRDCGEPFNGGKLHVRVSARLPLMSRGASSCLMIFDQLFIDIFFSPSLTTATSACPSPRRPPPSLMRPSESLRRTSTMFTSLTQDAT